MHWGGNKTNVPAWQFADISIDEPEIRFFVPK
jgi:hypothetical protein